MPILKNVEVRWASVQKPNTKFEPVYTVDVLLTPETKKELEEAIKAEFKKGDRTPKTRNDDDGNILFKFKRKAFSAKGEPSVPPIVRDIHNRDFTGLIGNGSICNIMYGVYRWENSFGKGVSLDFRGIQVLKLVEYNIEEFSDEFNENSDAREDFEDTTLF